MTFNDFLFVKTGIQQKLILIPQNENTIPIYSDTPEGFSLNGLKLFKDHLNRVVERLKSRHDLSPMKGRSLVK